MSPVTNQDRKTMLLTGAGRSIGYATVELFQDQGSRILAVSRQPFSEECCWVGARERHIQADLQNQGVISRATGDAIEFCPPLIISDAQVDDLLAGFRAALDAAVTLPKAA